MKYNGDLFYNQRVERNAVVTDAIVSKTRISIDWEEDGELGHLDATSKDGERYMGQYGYPTKDPMCKFELMLYRATDEVLLFGTWREDEDEGVWAFRLLATQPAHKKKSGCDSTRRLQKPTGYTTAVMTTTRRRT